MKSCWILSILLLISGFAYAAEPAGIFHDAEQKLRSGRIREAKAILESLSNADHLTIEQKAAANNKLAWFYEEWVGNYAYAERYSRKVLQFSLPASHRVVIESANRIKRLRQYASKYRRENQVINKLKVDASSRSDAEFKIKELERIIQNCPGHPSLPVAYHYIGKHYLYLEKYYKSYKILSKVLKMRPGIIFLIPTESLMNQAKVKWRLFLVENSARLIIVSSLFLIFICLYRSKFWMWMDLNVFIILPIMILLWALFLPGAAWVLNFFIPDQTHLYLETPHFIQSIPFSPGSEILFKIFCYGVLVIVASFLLTLATQNFKWPKGRTWFNSTVLILFAGSVFTLFYLNNCYTSGIFEKRANSVFPVVAGHTYLRERDYEPLILTNPRKYPDLSLSRCSDEHFRDWLGQQYSIIGSQAVAGTAKK